MATRDVTRVRERLLEALNDFSLDDPSTNTGLASRVRDLWTQCLATFPAPRHGASDFNFTPPLWALDHVLPDVLLFVASTLHREAIDALPQGHTRKLSALGKSFEVPPDVIFFIVHPFHHELLSETAFRSLVATRVRVPLVSLAHLLRTVQSAFDDQVAHQSPEARTKRLLLHLLAPVIKSICPEAWHVWKPPKKPNPKIPEAEATPPPSEPESPRVTESPSPQEDNDPSVVSSIEAPQDHNDPSVNSSTAAPQDHQDTSVDGSLEGPQDHKDTSVVSSPENFRKDAAGQRSPERLPPSKGKGLEARQDADDSSLVSSPKDFKRQPVREHSPERLPPSKGKGLEALQDPDDTSFASSTEDFKRQPVREHSPERLSPPFRGKRLSPSPAPDQSASAASSRAALSRGDAEVFDNPFQFEPFDNSRSPSPEPTRPKTPPFPPLPDGDGDDYSLGSPDMARSPAPRFYAASSPAPLPSADLNNIAVRKRSRDVFERGHDRVVPRVDGRPQPEDLVCLGSKTCLNDVVVNTAVSDLIDWVFGRESEVCYVDSLTPQTRVLTERGRRQLREKLSAHKVIYLPTHDAARRHWLLFRCVLQPSRWRQAATWVVEKYDSLPLGAAASQQQERGILSFLSEHGITCQHVVDVPCARQPNEYDCGLYVVAFVHCLLHNFPVEFASGELESEGARRRLLHSIRTPEAPTHLIMPDRQARLASSWNLARVCDDLSTSTKGRPLPCHDLSEMFRLRTVEAGMAQDRYWALAWALDDMHARFHNLGEVASRPPEPLPRKQRRLAAELYATFADCPPGDDLSYMLKAAVEAAVGRWQTRPETGGDGRAVRHAHALERVVWMVVAKKTGLLLGRAAMLTRDIRNRSLEFKF
ncbi:hypothetical protein QBC39DRAFT_386512 [Podospora conica]|nr:hypothetical protein QBC39DRAFT_386512 [Schizothecium conicum]